MLQPLAMIWALVAADFGPLLDHSSPLPEKVADCCYRELSDWIALLCSFVRQAVSRCCRLERAGWNRSGRRDKFGGVHQEALRKLYVLRQCVAALTQWTTWLKSASLQFKWSPFCFWKGAWNGYCNNSVTCIFQGETQKKRQNICNMTV